MGIDLPRDLGSPRLPFSRLARIIQHLPETSATYRTRTGNRAGLQLQLLRRIEYWTHMAAWFKTKDAKSGANRPTMIPLRGDTTRRRGLDLDEKLARQTERERERQAQLEGRSPRPTKEA